MDQTAPMAASQVEKEFDILEETINATLQNLDFLEARLTPVLRSADPQLVSDKTAEDIPLVPLATRITRNQMRIRNVNVRLQDVLNRLEI